MEIGTNPIVPFQQTGPLLADFVAVIAAIDPARAEAVAQEFAGADEAFGTPPLVAPPVPEPDVTVGIFAEIGLGEPGAYDTALQQAADLFETLPPGFSVFVVQTDTGFAVAQADGAMSLDDVALALGRGPVLQIASFGEVVPDEDGVSFDPSDVARNINPIRNDIATADPGLSERD